MADQSGERREHIVIFWKGDDTEQSGEEVEPQEGGLNNGRFLLRYYHVFNLESVASPATRTA